MMKNFHWRACSARHRLAVSTILVMLLVAVAGTAAGLTPAGTIIDSTATVTWQDAADNSYQAEATVQVEVLPVAGVDLDVITSATRVMRPATTGTHQLQLTNTGNQTDDFIIALDLEVWDKDNNPISSAGWSMSITSGNVNQNVDGTYTYPSLAQDASAQLSVALTAPAGATDGQQARITATATSDFDAGVFDSQLIQVWITDTYLVVTITAEKDGQPLAPSDQVSPGDTINYTIDIYNDGSGTATNIWVQHQLPASVDLVEGSIAVVDENGVPVPGYTIVYDPVTRTITVTSDAGTELPGYGTVQILFDVVVDPNAEPDTEITGTVDVEYDDSSGKTMTPPSYSLPPLYVGEAEGVTVTREGPAAATKTVGDEVQVPFIVKNIGNVTDTFALNLTDTESPSIWALYWDVDGDGENLQLLTDPMQTPPLAPGASARFVAVATVPAKPDGWENTLTLTAQSTRDPSASDSASFSLTVSVGQMSITLSGVALEPTQNVPDPPTPLELVMQQPGGKVEFTVTVTNNGSAVARNVVVNMPIPEYTTFVANSLVVVTGKAGFSVSYNAASVQIVSTAVNFDPGAAVVFKFQVMID